MSRRIPTTQDTSVSSAGYLSRDSFCCVSALVRLTYGGCGVAIGVSHKSHITLIPEPHEVFTWSKDHRIVAITRREPLG